MKDIELFGPARKGVGHFFMSLDTVHKEDHNVSEIRIF